MIKIKDIVEFLLFGLGFAGLVVISAILESSPIGMAMWIAVVLALILWGLWLFLVIRERRQEAEPLLTDPELWISNGREWVSMADPTKTKPFIRPLTRRDLPREGQVLFDQDNAS